MCLVKKQKEYLKKVKQKISERIDFNFKEYSFKGKDKDKDKDKEKPFSEVLKNLIGIDENNKEKLTLNKFKNLIGMDQKDIKEIVVSIDQKLTELNFYNHIMGKNKHELELLKSKYKKEILLCNNLYVSFETTLSMTGILLNTVLPVMAILVALVTAYKLDRLVIDVILLYMVGILTYSAIQIWRFGYHIRVKNLTVIFNNIMESCISDIDKRLYEIENRINMEGYNTYMINIKPENKMGGSDK